jgi:hypothetical protein
MNMEQLNHLETMAMAATPGGWQWMEDTGSGKTHYMVVSKETRQILFDSVNRPRSENEQADMEFAAAANPKAVLDLIAAAKQILDSHADLLEALKFAREKINEMDYDNGDGDCHYPLIEDAIEYAERTIASADAAKHGEMTYGIDYATGNGDRTETFEKDVHATPSEPQSLPQSD